MNDAFKSKRVLVGVTGGIAAYKVCTLVSRLVQAGADVTVAMTDGATKFVTPLTFASLSGKQVYSTLWEHIGEGGASDPQHIALARSLDAAIGLRASWAWRLPREALRATPRARSCGRVRRCGRPASRRWDR